MRVLFFILVVFAFSVAAQTPLAKQSFEKATIKAQNAQYEAAIKNYRTAIFQARFESTNDDFLAVIYFNIGVCYYQLKNSGKAVEKFTEAIKLSRRDYQKAFYALGMAHGNLKNWRKAATAFRRAVELKPDDGETWFDLAMVTLEEEDYVAAEKAFQKAIKYKSVSYADAHNNLGVIAVLKGDFGAAENEFENALIASNGKSSEARNNLQFCKTHKQNYNRDLLAKLEFSHNRQGE